VLYGTLANPRLNAGPDAVSAGGTTDLRLERVVKSDPFLGDQKVVAVSRYIPVDAKNPPKFVVFCDVVGGKLDAYRGFPARSPAVVDYLRGALDLEGQPRSQALLYFFRHLDHADPDVAADAFLELARASDQELGTIAGQLAADKLRRLLQDPQTPAERLNLFAFLLGACGGARDADLLRSLLRQATPRTTEALDGLLGGYIQLRPREGWELALAWLRDGHKPFRERFLVLRALRFFYNWKPAATRREVLRGLALALEQGDLADLAVEDLRRWQLWDLTPAVLAQYGKESHAAPIVRRALVRYLLSCPQPEAGRFVAELRRQDPELVKELEEALQFERN
jgi:hypothetical protein